MFAGEYIDASWRHLVGSICGFVFGGGIWAIAHPLSREAAQDKEMLNSQGLQANL